MSENRTVMLPATSKEIIQRLSTVLDEPNVVEKLYTGIAENAGRELSPPGIVMMFVLAAYDFGQEYPPPTGAIVQRFIPRWIDALVDDKEVAEAAKELLKKAGDESAAEWKVQHPRVEPKGPVENYALYVAARKVGDIFFEEVRKVQKGGAQLNVTFIDEGANPYYNQTDSGIFLEYYYGHPSKVWTPWGYWNFAWHVSYSGDPWPPILERVLERLGATEFMPERNESYGTVGPVYAIHRVDKIELPEPKLRERQNYLEYKVAKQAWDNMTRRYLLKHEPWQLIVRFIRQLLRTAKMKIAVLRINRGVRTIE